LITLFVAASLAAVFSAVGVVVARVPIHSVLALIMNFISLAVLYLTIDSEFIALIQILVYAGAVMVLFVFVIGLLTTRRDAAEPRSDRLLGQRALAAAAGSAAVLLLGLAALGEGWRSPQVVESGFGGVAYFGAALLQQFVLPFELTAFVLLVAVVGVVVLVGKRD
jgi:NADH-quinone oxidoreductase subunit J